MISNYCSYIKNYLQKPRGSNRPIPGEHHFVAAYLVPKLYQFNLIVPDFINPDGTKAILGDIVYFKDGSHHFGIEAKLGTIRLTKREFNDWIVELDTNKWPNVFVGVGTKGIGVSSWAAFRNAYIAAVKKDQPAWVPSVIAKGYGPTKAVNLIFQYLDKDANFQYSTDAFKIDENELAFTAALRKCFGG